MKFWELRASQACLALGLLPLSLAAVPSGFAQTNPSSTQTATGSSQHVQLEGELEVLNKDFKDHAEVSYTLKLANGDRIPMQFAKEPPGQFVTGDHVQAEGDLSGNTLLLYTGSNLTSGGNGGTSTSSTSSTSGPVPNTFGPQSTLVILVNFQDSAAQPYAVSDMLTMFSGSVNNFVMENSHGQTSIVPKVVGWYTIPVSVTTCSLSQIATDAQNAAAAGGVVLSNYTRYVYAFPQDNACGFAGSSNVGGNPSQSWINGNTLDSHVIDHELGHAFGLWHAHSLDCGTSATICSTGTVVEYGDRIDTMGTPGMPSPDYNAFQKERLGWLNYGNSPSITTVASSGTYTITPFEQGAGPNALKILKSTDSTTGAKTWYYLEARQAVGSDSFLTDSLYSPQNETTGVLFHLGADGNGNSSELIDMTPATPTFDGWYDPSLVAGQSFTDSTAGVTITPTTVSSSGATVQITINGSSTTSSGSLTTSVTTNQPSYMPGQNVSVTVTVDSGPTPAAGVSVTATVTNPNGNSSTLKGTTGSSGTALLNYNLSKHAPAGTYKVGAAAGAAGASTSFNVQ